ncbi:DNA-3-methyladenine glycosylase family protein [Tepidimonas sp.]|uniref:DNA-3-methyladenine glycosylase family protein n=1 Tax=Tepidimonas sp. TaxID=2002775 RepID=UPI002FE1DD97
MSAARRAPDGACVPSTALPAGDGFVPAFWAQACDHLAGRDRVMARLIPQFPGACLRSRGDAFTTLARSVVGQQISVKAAQAVWDRLEACLGGCTAAAVLARAPEELRAAGLSARKVEYLLDLARHFDDGRIDPAAWHAMDDEAIIRDLTAIRGIGRWTAEMFLIFHLMRPDVLPLDDVGLLRGISQCYFSGEPVSRSDAREVAAAWAPYRSVATWYIWRSLDPIPVAY